MIPVGHTKFSFFKLFPVMAKAFSLDKTLRFIHAMHTAADHGDVAEALLHNSSALGISSIFGGIIPNLTLPPQDIASRVLIQEFPEEWAIRYNSRGYVYRDPIVERLQTERMPFSWRDAYDSAASPENARTIDGEAREFGLHQGFVFPIELLDNSAAALSFGGAKLDLAPEDRSLLGFLASCAISSLIQKRHGRFRAPRQVSAREYDCLLWAAEGKTDWEIAMILGISKPTVTKHILSARLKLDAQTKAHAIAIALREKILR